MWDGMLEDQRKEALAWVERSGFGRESKKPSRSGKLRGGPLGDYCFWTTSLCLLLGNGRGPRLLLVSWSEDLDVEGDEWRQAGTCWAPLFLFVNMLNWKELWRGRATPSLAAPPPIQANSSNNSSRGSHRRDPGKFSFWSIQAATEQSNAHNLDIMYFLIPQLFLKPTKVIIKPTDTGLNNEFLCLNKNFWITLRWILKFNDIHISYCLYRRISNLIS